MSYVNETQLTLVSPQPVQVYSTTHTAGTPYFQLNIEEAHANQEVHLCAIILLYIALISHSFSRFMILQKQAV